MTLQTIDAEAGPKPGRFAAVLVATGAILAVAAGVALWASEGAGIFLEGALNSLLTCF
jgi:hypothetical protein